ncbi:MAG TPA: NAD(P)H-hydrate dehydratase [Candidatus Polarisedimenticolia bacterium]|nr:NAD(P)H-hydrate dehydratase [Candidatus Polarisedimenticolia bacterium]
MKILTAEQMRRIDERAERDFGLTPATLMENAGRAVAQSLLKLYPGLEGLETIVVCGKGNNGGDGLCAARHLRAAGVPAQVVLLAEAASLTGAAAHHLELARREGVAVEQAPTEQAWEAFAPRLHRCALILDAVLGTGLKGGARGLPARAITDINASGADVVSVDIPSGLSGDSPRIQGPTVRAELTMALACPKIPHVFEPGASLTGRLQIVDIGIPAEAVQAEEVHLNLLGEEEVSAILPPREADSHKGDYGRVLVVAGSRGKSGAAGLVGLSALRAGAGLVTVATPLSAQPMVAASALEIMTEGLPETPPGALSAAAAPALKELERGCTVLAIGPGLTAGEETSALVREMVSGASVPVVLDADGLNAFTGRAEELRGDDRPLVLTPHPGEMARLLSAPRGPQVTAAQIQADRVEAARSFAVGHGCLLILKGHRTVIADPEGDVFINPTGNPGMATAGSGDALTGIIAGLLGQGLAPLEAAALAVYVHGLAGDLAAADHGENALMARDIIDYLPEAFLQLEGAAD